MEAAYLKASANDTLPAKARQVMYAARGTIQDRTGKSLDDRVLHADVAAGLHGGERELTADWNVVFDARGHLVEPHTGTSRPARHARGGKLSAKSRRPALARSPSASMPGIETSGPSGRYGALLFCEKEGFNELFRAVQLAERYDLAIM